MRESNEISFFSGEEDNIGDGIFYFDSFATFLYRINWRGAIRTMIAVFVAARGGVTPDTLYLFEDDDTGSNAFVVELSPRNAEPQSIVQQEQMTEEEAFNAACAADFLSRQSIKMLSGAAKAPQKKELQSDGPKYQQPTQKMSTEEGAESLNPYEYKPCEYNP